MDLITASKGMKDKVIAGIILDWAIQSQLMQRMPFMDVDSFWLKTWKNTSVTDATFRDIGESYSETSDSFQEAQEGIYLLGGKIDIDRALKLPGQREIDAYAQNLVLQAKRFMFTFHQYFINGDRTTDPKGFDGLKTRLTSANPAYIDAGSPLNVAASSANRQTFLDKLDECLWNLRGQTADVICTSKEGLWNLIRVARREGLLDVTRDAFDRAVDSYKGIPLMYMGTKGDQSTAIIGAAEGTGTNETSYYPVVLSEKAVTGIQMHAPKRLFDDITDDGVTHRVVFEWPVGLALWDSRAAGRLYGVQAIGS